MATHSCSACGDTVEAGVAGLIICTGCGEMSLPGAKPGASTGRKPKNQSRPRKRTPKVDSKQIDNYLELAEHAIDSGNFREAEAYATKVIEIQPTSWQAWTLKGRAAGWQSRTGSLRLRESSAAFVRAVEVSSEGTRDSMRSLASSYMSVLAVAAIKMWGNHYARDPSPRQAEAFNRDLNEVIQAVRELLNRADAPPQRIWESIATEVNNAVVKAWAETIQKDYKAEKYPGEYAFDRFRERIPPALKLLETSIGLSSDDDAEDIVRHRNIILLAESLRDAKSYKNTVNGYVVKYTLTSESIAANNRQIAASRQEIARLERSEADKKAREERRKADERREAYWSHSKNRKKKAELEAERAELEKLRTSLQEEEASVPGEAELKEAQAKVDSLQEQLDATGFFKRSERKTLQEQLTAAKADRDQRAASIREAKDALKERLRQTEERLATINNELTRPR